AARRSGSRRASNRSRALPRGGYTDAQRRRAPSAAGGGPCAGAGGSPCGAPGEPEGSAPHRLPGHDGTDRRPFVVEGVAFGEIGAAPAGDVDRREGLLTVSGNEGGDATAVRGEDGIGLGAVGDLAELARPAAADPLHPEALVAAEEDRLAVRSHVFDESRAGAADEGPRLGRVQAHREDIGIGGGSGFTLAAAIDDAALEEAGRELVVAVGEGDPLQTGAGGTHGVDVVGEAAIVPGHAAH